MAPRRPTPDQRLTDVELEMMNVLWQHGPCTVKGILAALPKERPLAYTTVSTVVRILEQKGYVVSHKAGRGHLYEPLLAKESYQRESLNHLVRHVFDNAPSAMVRHLLQSQELTPAELDTIAGLLAAHQESP